MVLVLLVPTAASAEVPGGTDWASATPLPVASFDESFSASNASVVSSPGAQQAWNNVAWYTVTPSTTTTTFIRATSTDPLGWDNTLEVWTSGGLVVQNDDYYGLDASLRVTLAAGTTYYVGLGGYHQDARGTVTMTFASRTPSAPQSVSASAEDGAALVSWAVPADVAGGVTQYTVHCTPVADPGAEFECGSEWGTPPSTQTWVSGLTNGAGYTFRVTASNAIGAGDFSAPSAAVTPMGVPSVTLSTEPAVPVSGQAFDVVATVTAGGAPAEGVVDLTVAGTTTTGLALVGGQARIAGIVRSAGPVALGATYAGSSSVLAGTGSLAATVAKRSQTVSFTAVPAGQVYDGTPVPLVATASSGMPVTFGATGACTVTGGSLHFTGVGTCTVTALQVGDSETEAATASQAFEVGKRSQTVALDALPALVYDQEPITLAPASSVGLPVTLAASGACTLTGTVLTATSVGTCEVTATQAGDAVTLPATTVVRSAAVTQRPQTVTLTQLPELTFGLAPITMVASSEFGLPVTLAATGACSFVDGALKVIGVGLCTVTATAEGDALTLPGTATTSGDVRGVPTDVEVDLDADLGATAEGVTVSATGTGLLPGSELVLEVHSTPQVIGRVTVGADGTAVVSGVLPELEAGDHEIVALGTALDGTPNEFVLGFAVNAAGTVVRIATATLPADEVVAVSLARTGADAADAGALAALWLVVGAGLVVLRRRLDARTHARVATR